MGTKAQGGKGDSGISVVAIGHSSRVGVAWNVCMDKRGNDEDTQL